MIPAGGTQQKVTVTVTPRDLRYDTLPGCFDIIISSNLPGVSVKGWTAPTDATNPGDNPQSLVDLRLCTGLHTRQTYTFTATLKVPNPHRTAFRFQPEVAINGQLITSSASVIGSSVAIPDATLDGTSPGQGGSTFSVDGSHIWMAMHAEAADIDYAGTPPPPVCTGRHHHKCRPHVGDR
jgi:hypothetical protein